MARLILLEGIPGSGKTTLTSRLCALLREAGTPRAAWLEGQSDHPVELEHHACLTQEEYAALCAEFPGEAGALAAHAHAEGDFLLVRYLEDRAPVFSGALLSHLMAREFRYALAPCIPLASYTAVSLSRWRSLAARMGRQAGVSSFGKRVFAASRAGFAAALCLAGRGNHRIPPPCGRRAHAALPRAVLSCPKGCCRNPCKHCRTARRP